MAAAPVPVRLRARGQRRAQDLPGVVRRAADLGDVPVRAEVGGAHRRVGLKAARRQHDRAGAQRLARAVGPAHGDALARHEPLGRGVVADLDAGARGRGHVLVDQAAAAVDRSDRQPAPEPVAPAGLVGLALVQQPEADAAAGHPAQHVARVAGEHARHRDVAAPERDPRHVGHELVGGVGREVGDRQALVVADEVAQVVEPAVREPHRARGEGRVAARPRPRGLLQHEHPRAPLARGVGRAHAGVAGSHHDHIGVHAFPPTQRFTAALPRRSRRPRGCRHAVDPGHRALALGAQGALVLRRPPPGRARDRCGLRRAAAARLRAARLGLGRDRGADGRPRSRDAARPAAGRADRPHEPARLRDRRRADRRAGLRGPDLRRRHARARRPRARRGARERPAAARDLRAAARGGHAREPARRQRPVRRGARDRPAARPRRRRRPAADRRARARAGAQRRHLRLLRLPDDPPARPPRAGHPGARPRTGRGRPT